MNDPTASKTTWPPIVKSPDSLRVPPNLADYGAECRGFTWDAIRGELKVSKDGRLNIGSRAVDRHAHGGLANKTALICLSRFRNEDARFTYAELLDATQRFGGILADLGVHRGDRVFTLCGRVPLLYIAALGALRYGAVFCPLFSAFGPEPIHQRLTGGSGKVLVTTARLYERRIAPQRDALPDLRHVLLVDAKTEDEAPAGTHSLPAMMAAARPRTVPPATRPEDHALLHFTSGTTGQPKGAVHVHEAVLMHFASAKYALDLHREDVFWCTADPGWVTGTSYGIIAPLLHGATMVVDEEELDIERWYDNLAELGVTVWYTAPTAVRMLMKAGLEPLQGRRFPKLRFIASVGEPLHPEGVVWGMDAFGMPIHDNWWQTETGAIMIANYAAMTVRPGSMGKPLPGIEAGIVKHVGRGRVEEVTEPDVQGELALRPGWPSMFRDYLHQHERYERCFADGWYLSGDLARRDRDGYFWFVGRADDVIKTSGHLTGPFEVESALMEHPAVAEAGVIGIPDEVAGEIVKAYVVLRHGYEPGEDLRMDLIGFARKKLGAAIAPRQIEFKPGLPKTRSGKIMRRLIKARELGLEEGDTSAVEEDAH
ncbi:MAG: acetate--CoA ligase [Arenicellales bacterium]